MSASTRQHYVPQFLLRHFRAKGRRSQVWTYDKQTGAVRLQSIRDSGHEKGFYEHEVLENHGIDLEAELADFEAQVAPVITVCVSEHSLRSIGPPGRAAILNFAVVQLFRTKAAREFAKVGSEQVFGQQISDRDAREVSFQILLQDFSQYLRCCESHIITLREAQASERFLLGDGVTLISSTSPEPSNSFKMALRSAIIVVPVCPRLAIMAFPQTCEAELHTAGAWYRSTVRVLDEAQPAAQGDVDSINAMSVFTSNRFLFSSTADFADATRLITANPLAKRRPVGNRDRLVWHI